MPQHDRNEALLTIAELARSLNLPESTTRYYCRRFAVHLPSSGDGRRRRYLPEALPLLRTIAESMRRNKNSFAVDLVLREQEARSRPQRLGRGKKTAAEENVLEPLPASDQVSTVPGALSGQIMSLMERQTQALQQIAGAMAVFAERIAATSGTTAPETTPALPAPAASEETETLRDEVAALRRQIRSAEAVHQNDLEQMRKWLARLGEAMSKRPT